MEETVFYCRADLIVKFEFIVKNEAKVLCAGMDIGGEGAQGVGGRGWVVSKNDDFRFVII